MKYVNGTVRRQDRLLDEARALELVRTCEYGVLSMVTAGGRLTACPLITFGTATVAFMCIAHRRAGNWKL